MGVVERVNGVSKRPDQDEAGDDKQLVDEGQLVAKAQLGNDRGENNQGQERADDEQDDTVSVTSRSKLAHLTRLVSKGWGTGQKEDRRGNVEAGQQTGNQAKRHRSNDPANRQQREKQDEA